MSNHCHGDCCHEDTFEFSEELLKAIEEYTKAIEPYKLLEFFPAESIIVARIQEIEEVEQNTTDKISPVIELIQQIITKANEIKPLDDNDIKTLSMAVSKLDEAAFKELMSIYEKAHNSGIVPDETEEENIPSPFM